MRAYGADCLQEHGKVIILGGSIDDYPEKTVPWKEVGWFHNKMKITEFKTIIEITSTTSAKVSHRRSFFSLFQIFFSILDIRCI